MSYDESDEATAGCNLLKSVEYLKSPEPLSFYKIHRHKSFKLKFTTVPSSLISA